VHGAALARAAQDVESAKRALKDWQARAARVEDTLERHRQREIMQVTTHTCSHITLSRTLL